MITLSNLAKRYGEQVLFANASLQLNPGNRYGLVGANGSGKSTLLRIIGGEEEASEGTISLPRRLRLGVLSQDHFKYEADPILDVVMMGNAELWRAIQEKEEVLAHADRSFDSDRYAELEEVILRHDGYAMEARAGEILEGLGIPVAVHQQPMSTLSGGFKLRVLLAQVLASAPDALLLDEPTNHLDILSIRWLERFLESYPGCVIVVSHDHRFLDNVCNYIVDIDYETATLYPGNYSKFSTAKVEDRQRKEAEIAKQEKKIADQRAFVDRFRAKATKARQAQSKLKQIERIDIERLPQSSRRYPTFRFEQRRPSGKRVLEIEGLAKSYGDNVVLKDVSLEVQRGDRLAIIGPNGIGKSTLLHVMTGRTRADTGKVDWGYETHPGFFAQDPGQAFHGSKADVESWLWDVCPGERIGFVRSKLALVLFSGDDVKKRVSALSGGEMARLLFCRLHVEQPNVLLLDEPTNHLDLESIEALVKGLEAYPGTLVFVSHDRWFVSRLANRVLELTADGPRDFRGTYEEYLDRCGDDHLDAETVLLQVKRDKKKARARDSGRRAPDGDPRERRRRQARLKDLVRKRDETTRDIERAEARVRDIDERFCDPEFYTRTPQAEVRKLEAEQRKHRERIARLMESWETVEAELAELES